MRIELKHQTSSQIINKLWVRLYDQLYYDLYCKFRTELHNQLSWQLRDQLGFQLGNKFRYNPEWRRQLYSQPNNIKRKS